MNERVAEIFETGARDSDLDRFRRAIGNRARAATLRDEANQLESEAGQLDNEAYLAPDNVTLEVFRDQNRHFNMQRLTGGDHFPLKYLRVEPIDQHKYGVTTDNNYNRFVGRVVEVDPKTNSTWIYTDSGETRVKWEEGVTVKPWAHENGLDYSVWRVGEEPGIRIRVSPEEYLIYERLDFSQVMYWTTDRSIKELVLAAADQYPERRMSVRARGEKSEEGWLPEAESLLDKPDVLWLDIELGPGQTLTFTENGHHKGEVILQLSDKIFSNEAGYVDAPQPEMNFEEIITVIRAVASAGIVERVDDIGRLISPYLQPAQV